MRKHLLYLKDEQDKLIHELPLSSFGPQRVPKNICTELLLGQQGKRQIKRDRRKMKEHVLLKQFSVRGLPKQRFYNIKCDNPLDASLNNDSDFSLQQYLGNSVDDIDEERKMDQEFDNMPENEQEKLLNNLLSKKDKRSNSEKMRTNNCITLRNEEVKESFATNFYEEVLPDNGEIKKERRCKSVSSDMKKPKMIKVAKQEKIDQILPSSESDKKIEVVDPEDAAMEENNESKKKVQDATKCCHSMIQVNSDYLQLRSNTRQLINEADDAAVYFQEELLQRLNTTA